MKHKLVIFTQDFPYGKGETFLESELPYLENGFDGILIVSTALHKGYQLTRKIDAVTRTLPIIRPNGMMKQIWGVANGLRYLTKNVNNEIRKYKSIKKKIAVLYYTGRYESVKRKCRNEIETFVGEDREQTVTLYSYWFIETAQIAIDIAKQLKNKGISCASCTRAHGFDLYEKRNPIGLFPFRERVFEEIDYIFPCSADGEMYLKLHYPEYERKISKRYLGTFDYGMNPETENQEFTIVTCSNLISIKRLQLLAEALQLIDDSEKKVHLRWVCIGDGPEKEQLHHSTIAFRNICVVFAGSMKNKEVLTWYQNNHIDLLVNTSSSEGLPVSIMEAISFGIPVLATDVGGTSEIVIDGENGKLLPEDLTAEYLSNEILTFYDMKSSERKKYREKARKIWEESFYAKNNYRLFVDELVKMAE